MESLKPLLFAAALVLCSLTVLFAGPWARFVEMRGRKRMPGTRLAVCGWPVATFPRQPQVCLVIVAPERLVALRGFPSYRREMLSVPYEDVASLKAESALWGRLRRPLPCVTIELHDGRSWHVVVWSKSLLYSSAKRRDELLTTLTSALAIR